jgi:elongation of very long chain fatty acids protein 6
MQSFFSLLFVFSKLVEFGDTFFVIMRKTPLNFVHWYHHTTVSIISWHSLSIKSGPAHWYCAVNYVVHSVMYSYYVIKSTGFRMPSAVAMAVTMLQMAQFVIGMIVSSTAAYVYLYQGQFCFVNVTNILLGTAIYSTYLALFGNFFFHRYILPKQAKQKKIE